MCRANCSNLRTQAMMQQAANPMRIRQVRKLVARIQPNWRARCKSSRMTVEHGCRAGNIRDTDRGTMTESTAQQRTDGRTARKVREGLVVSDKMDKTAVVAVERLKRHPLYGRVQRVTKRFKAHDETNECKVGDRVRIMETRPLSKTEELARVCKSSNARNKRGLWALGVGCWG